MDVNPRDNGNIEIDGETPRSYPFTLTVDYGTTVVLEAVPVPGYHFVKWDGEPTIDGESTLDIWIIRNIEITALFASDSGDFSSEDGTLNLFVPDSTIALDEEGKPLIGVDFIINVNPPPTEESSIIGQAYDLEPDGATFDPPVTLAWSYESAYFPQGIDEEELSIAYYDEDTDEWVALESEVDPEAMIITALVDHLATFTILVPAVPLPSSPAGATLTTSNLSLSPSEVNTGASVIISMQLTNTGEIEGSYIATLKINGVIEETEQVTLNGGASQTVTFTTSREVAGTYLVDVNGLTGSFIVREGVVSSPPPAPSIEPPPSVEPPSSQTPTQITPSQGINWPVVAPILSAIFLAIFLPIKLKRRGEPHER